MTSFHLFINININLMMNIIIINFISELSAYYFVCAPRGVCVMLHSALPFPLRVCSLCSVQVLHTYHHQQVAELIIAYHSWRTYPKSKHLTPLIRLMHNVLNFITPSPPYPIAPTFSARCNPYQCATFLLSSPQL